MSGIVSGREVARRLESGGESVAVLGDVNSTGFLEDRNGERTFIEEEAKRAGLDVMTRGLACSEYFGPLEKDGPLVPSLLDHVVGTPGFARRGSAKVHGYCAALACAPVLPAPEDFTMVSDHCPVTIDVAR